MTGRFVLGPPSAEHASRTTYEVRWETLDAQTVAFDTLAARILEAGYRLGGAPREIYAEGRRVSVAWPLGDRATGVHPRTRDA